MKLYLSLTKTFIILACLFSHYAQATSPVFKIEKDNKISYLVGTVHLLTAQDHPLPKPIDTAFNAAQTVVFETDIKATQTPAFQQKLMQAISLAPPKTIQDTLKPETYQKLVSYMTQNGLSMTQFKQFNAAGLALMLSVIELSKLGNVAAFGVEQTYMQKIGDKKLRTLETVDEQIAFVANLANGQEDIAILKTLDELPKLKSQLQALKKHWREGDFNNLDKVGNQPMRDDFPQMYQSLLIDRNRAWAPKIQAIHSKQNVAVFMVGALHLAGKDSIIAMLEKVGFKVTQL